MYAIAFDLTVAETEQQHPKEAAADILADVRVLMSFVSRAPAYGSGNLVSR